MPEHYRLAHINKEIIFNYEFNFSNRLQPIKKIPSRNNGSNIRSVSFKGNILTIGNGSGVILFWDQRAGKFLDSTMNTNRAVTLKASRGWVVSYNNTLWKFLEFSITQILREVSFATLRFAKKCLLT